MKKLIFTASILALIFCACNSYPDKVVIEPQLLKTFDSLSHSPLTEQNVTYDRHQISVATGDDDPDIIDEIILFQLGDEKNRDLHLSPEGKFLRLRLYDEEIKKSRTIYDPDDEVAQKIIKDFIGIMNQAIAVDNKIKKVNKILAQDFLSQKDIFSLMVCRENIRSSPYSSRKYSDLEIILGDELDSAVNLKIADYWIEFTDNLTEINYFRKTNNDLTEYWLGHDYYIRGDKKGSVWEMEDEDLKFFENEISALKTKIRAQIN